MELKKLKKILEKSVTEAFLFAYDQYKDMKAFGICMDDRCSELRIILNLGNHHHLHQRRILYSDNYLFYEELKISFPKNIINNLEELNNIFRDTFQEKGMYDKNKMMTDLFFDKRKEFILSLCPYLQNMPRKKTDTHNIILKLTNFAISLQSKFN